MNWDDVEFDNEPKAEAPAPMPMTFAEAAGEVLECAKSLAIQKKLIRSDGTLACWGCHVGDGAYPSLHCKTCLEAFRARESETVVLRWSGQAYEFPRETEASWQLKVLCRNMADKSYDKPTCDGILANAVARADEPGMPQVIEMLREIHASRFGFERRSEPEDWRR